MRSRPPRVRPRTWRKPKSAATDASGCWGSASAAGWPSSPPDDRRCPIGSRSSSRLAAMMIFRACCGTCAAASSQRPRARLGARLLPYIGSYGAPPALSPSKSPKPHAPVFLLHGVDDNVIPAIESEYLAADLRGRTPVQVLVTPLIGHADVPRTPTSGEA